jgi:hypothetical protein
MPVVEQLDDKFVAHLGALFDVNEANAAAACSGAPSAWYYPPLDEWTGDPRDIKGMNAAFDRTAINELYEEVVGDPLRQGRQGEAVVLKLQLDYIAALERSFRTRHASSVRSKIHAAARRKGHGASGGLYDPSGGDIVLWLQRLLAAAHSDPEA